MFENYKKNQFKRKFVYIAIIYLRNGNLIIKYYEKNHEHLNHNIKHNYNIYY